MQLNKKILLITLSVSFFGQVKSMQKATCEEQQEIRKLVGGQTTHIGNYARSDEHNPEYMKTLGKWLTVQRIAITEDKKWNLLVEYLGKTVSLCGCHCEPNENTTAVKNVVTKIASELKPGEDCSQLLVESAQKAIHDAAILRAIRCPLFGNGVGADWYPASSTCLCKG